MFTKFRDATRAAAFSGCPRNLVLSSGPITARTSRRSSIFAPQPTVTLSRPCREKAKNTAGGHAAVGTAKNTRVVGQGTSVRQPRYSQPVRVQPRPRPRATTSGRRPAPETTREPPRPFRRPTRPPGGSGAPAGWSGVPPEARKAPKSKIGLPRPLLKWEAWGARCRFRPLETVGTASNMPVMA